jgi:hypothetical protein
MEKSPQAHDGPIRRWVVRPLLWAASAWDETFHSPVTAGTHRLTGFLRIYMAAVFLFDQALWGLDRGWLQSPGGGVLSPNKAFPTDLHFWTAHHAGTLCGVGLLLGVFPRLCALGVFYTLKTFHNNFSPCAMDLQDDMLRIWALHFLFLPLDSVTVYDAARWWAQRQRRQQPPPSGLGDGGDSARTKDERTAEGNSEDLKGEGTAAVAASSSSPAPPSPQWTMWPYRLAQFQVFCIYVGASTGKSLSSDSWTSGLELWRAMHEHIFCKSGLWQPAWMLNTLMSLKILAWSALLLEHVALVTVWPAATRRLTIVAMVLFHLGIEVTMNMHTLQYTSILGWLFFLAEPEKREDMEEDAATATTSGTGKASKTAANPPSCSVPAAADTPPPQQRCWTVPRLLSRVVIDPLVVTWIILAWAQSHTGSLLADALEDPPWRVDSKAMDHARTLLGPIVAVHNSAMGWVKDRAWPYTVALGIHQFPWVIFRGSSKQTAEGYRFYARIEYLVVDDDGEDQEDEDDEDGGALPEGSSPVYKTMIWASPDWSSMPWWQQKRYQRTMLFYEQLGTSNRITQKFCKRLFKDYNGGGYGGNHRSLIPGSIIYGEKEYGELAAERGRAVQVASILLLMAESVGPLYPPEDLGIWTVPAVIPHPDLTDYSVAYYHTPLPDVKEISLCRTRHREGECREGHPNSRFMWEDCPRTCSTRGEFVKALLVRPGTRIHDYLHHEPYTVLGRTEDSKFLYEADRTGARSEGDLFGLVYDLFVEERDGDDDPVGGYVEAFLFAVNDNPSLEEVEEPSPPMEDAAV